jgi:hypothetical protein
VRIRGTAVQVNEKYLALARDATSSGDRVMAESYFQHAEHYHRIIASINEAHTQAQQQSDAGNRQREDGQRGAGQREDGQRESGHRENGHREGGRQRDRDVPAGAAMGKVKQTDSRPEMEFGEDPRQDDARDAPLELTNGDAAIEVVGVPPVVEPKPAATRPAGNGKSAAAEDADAGGDDVPAPKPRRRGPGRPRKSAAAKDAAAAVPEANPDGDD